MLGTLAAEWLKLRSVRSTAYLLAVVAAGVGCCLLISVYVAGVWDDATVAQRQRISVSPMYEVSAIFSQICVAVLGVLAITSEYATGSIRGSLVVAPNRLRVLAAKAAVVGGMGWLIGTVSAIAALLGGRAIMGERAIASYHAPLAGEVRLAMASAVLVAVFGLVGLGIGCTLRSTPAAIVVVVLLWYVLPLLGLSLPDPWDDRYASVMLLALSRELAGADALTAGIGGPDYVLSPLGALTAIAFYILAALGSAALRLRRSDA
ncbi:ABC transporter permease [Flindersiella endophytica]